MSSTPHPFSWSDARAHGPSVGSAVIRSRSEDFRVDEILGFEADGEGPHLLLQVEKTDCNTAWVAGQIARVAGVPRRDVGYSGLKDRWAVTTQAFSVPAGTLTPEQWLAVEGEGYRVLSAQPHRRKLRRGSHQANRFRLVLRELSADAGTLERRLREIADLGVPNYFGEQRFGRQGRNLVLADRVLADPRRRWKREDREFAFSAARSALFNEVLAARVRAGNWRQLLAGDVVMLAGTRSVFRVDELDESIRARHGAGDLGATGPLPGESGVEPAGQVLALEAQVLAQHPGWVQGLCASRVKADRRRLVLAVQALDWSIEPDALTLSFELPSGSFATSVLAEILDYREAPRPTAG